MARAKCERLSAVQDAERPRGAELETQASASAQLDRSRDHLKDVTRKLGALLEAKNNKQLGNAAAGASSAAANARRIRASTKPARVYDAIL